MSSGLTFSAIGFLSPAVSCLTLGRWNPIPLRSFHGRFMSISRPLQSESAALVRLGWPESRAYGLQVGFFRHRFWLQYSAEDLVHMLDQYEGQIAPNGLRDFVKVPLIFARQHDRVQTGSMGGQNLVRDASHRKHSSAEGD